MNGGNRNVSSIGSSFHWNDARGHYDCCQRLNLLVDVQQRKGPDCIQPFPRRLRIPRSRFICDELGKIRACQ